MSPLKLRRLFARPRSRLALILVVTALGGAAVAHHTVLDMPGMAGVAGVVLCLAVLGGAMLVAGPVSALAGARVRPAAVRLAGTV